MARRKRRRSQTAINLLIGVIVALSLLLVTLLVMAVLAERKSRQEELQALAKLNDDPLSAGAESVLGELLSAHTAVNEEIKAPESSETNLTDASLPETEEEAMEEPEGSMLLSETEVQALINEALPGIVCWGDSITYGYLSDGTTYPAALQKKIDAELVAPIREKYGYPDLTGPTVRNFGVSAESTVEIAGRIGAIPYQLAASATIPGEAGSAVNVEIMDYRGDSGIRPIKDVEPHNGSDYNYAINPMTVVTPAGEQVKCRLERYYDDAADRSRYRLIRENTGDAVTAEAGSQLVSASAGAYKNQICIVLMGANGGYAMDGGADLTSQFQKCVSGYANFLCIGMGQEKTYTASAELEPGYAAYLKGQLGDSFISIQELLTGDVHSHIPSDLLNADGLHYTSAGYEFIGEQVYKKLDALGCFDGLKALAEAK